MFRGSVEDVWLFRRDLFLVFVWLFVARSFVLERLVTGLFVLLAVFDKTRGSSR